MLYETIPTRSHLLVKHVIVPIAAGAFIYIVFRSRQLLVFSWIDLVGFGGFVNDVRTEILPFHRNLPDWLIFSLPDALWTYAVSMFYLLLWENVKSPARYFWYGTAPLFGIGGEIGQFIGVVPGTFCFMDLYLCTAAFTITIFFLRKRANHARRSST